MIEAITIEAFAELSSNDREAYILDRTQLEDFWLIGHVRYHFEEKPFFFIEQLINPYTGVSLEAKIFNNFSRPLSIYCRKKAADKPYEDGTMVAAKFNLTESNNEIKKGHILNTILDEVYPIRDSDEIFDLVGMNKEDLGIIALAKPSLYKDRKSRFIDAANIIKTKIKDDIENLDLKIDENQKQLLYMERQEERLDKTKQNLYSLQQKLEELGFVFDKQPEVQLEETEESFLDTPETLSELLKGIQTQLSVRGYHYEEKTLRQILLALMTEQMIILSGPSGTGKTTIVKQLASIINAKYEIIPVQPSWTDKQDLLGFYNPIRKLYVPSAFLDCLIEAKQNEDKLYFICLDEMNLAQIEYYLADVLSIRELEDGKLRLYSDFEYEQNMNEIRWFIQRMSQEETLEIEEALRKIQMDSLAHYEMVTRFENLKRYSPVLNIPQNVRIIGTMNVDGAVQALSPKVIDRSFVIPLYRQESEKVASVSKIGQYDISAQYFTTNTTETPKFSNQLREAVKDIQQELKNWHIEYNERVERHILLYYVAAKNLGISTKQLADDITIMKLLPRIHEMVDDEQLITRLIEVVERHVKDELLSKRKLEKMQQRFEQTGLYSYWSC
ncbi:AAA family ATPase [Exiguobacterium sp. MER 193]|uniref:AAA family ATPase n=1 Tax=Exiguobacterium sp. MER 193 TaxID=2939564 RepID=UPI0020424FF3|nr:AAA family ATPase [Exiguobacterium sp. MER 193]MCM3281741.1 AAA family ATPase [Exiguobacterium sp. MER 193]